MGCDLSVQSGSAEDVEILGHHDSFEDQSPASRSQLHTGHRYAFYCTIDCSITHLIPSRNVIFPYNPHAIRHRPPKTNTRRLESSRSPPTNEDSLLPRYARSCRSVNESQRIGFGQRSRQGVDEGGIEGGTQTRSRILYGKGSKAVILPQTDHHLYCVRYKGIEVDT